MMRMIRLCSCLFMIVCRFGFAQANNDNNIGQTVNDGYGNYFLVPAGVFSMGDNYNEGRERERPVHRVYLDAYYIGEFEITNEEYKKFMDDGGYTVREFWSSGGSGLFSEPRYWYNSSYNGGGIKDNSNFPVCGISWYEAKAYCSWLSGKTGNVYRLPTEAEWEKAARGGDYLDGDTYKQVPNPMSPPRRYPWGNDIDGSYANYLDSGDPYDNGLTPVGYFDGSTHDTFLTHNNASPYGAYDMAGNVYEWCEDRYNEDYYQECLNAGIVTNPQGPRNETNWGPIIRGSAFLYETFKQRCAYRGSYYHTAREAYIGMRCVREISFSSLNDDKNQITESCILHQNLPNPFNAGTTIQFEMKMKCPVVLKVYNTKGHEIAVLINGEIKKPGKYSVTWDGRINEGAVASSGIYIYRLREGNYLQSKKMICLQ